MEISTVEELISYYKKQDHLMWLFKQLILHLGGETSNIKNKINFSQYCLFDKPLEEICYYLIILMLFDDVILHINNYQSFISFENWLKINYKGLYGWQKIQQIFLDNLNQEEFSDVVEKIQSLSLPSTFEIPSNWTIYAPILR